MTGEPTHTASKVLHDPVYQLLSEMWSSHYASLPTVFNPLYTYGTNWQQGKCVLHVHVTFACKRIALLSPACERVCLDILTHTFVFYHTSTYLYSNYILFAGVSLHGLQTSKPGHCRKASQNIQSNDDSKYIVTDDSQFSGWWGNENSRKEDLKVSHIPI